MTILGFGDGISAKNCINVIKIFNWSPTSFTNLDVGDTEITQKYDQTEKNPVVCIYLHILVSDFQSNEHSNVEMFGYGRFVADLIAGHRLK